LCQLLERNTGIEPVSHPWQGRILTIVRIPQNSNIIDKLKKGNKIFRILSSHFQAWKFIILKLSEYTIKILRNYPPSRGWHEVTGVPDRDYKI
jgi:hypothetical protein